MSQRAFKWLDRICRPIQWLIGFATFLGGFILCSVAVADQRLGPILSFLLTMPLLFGAIFIHELGHYVAAKWAGMTVTQVRVGRIEIIPQQRGWRIRWNSGQKIKVSGFVVGVCDPQRSMRRQALVMVAGGPVANLVMAAVVAALAVLWSSSAASLPVWAFAIFNAGGCMLNLLPTYRGTGSDGMLLLFWRQKLVEQSPLLAFTRLQALSIAGITADQLPVDQIAMLDSQVMPAPLTALWYRLKAHQNRGEWQQAAQLQEVYDRLMQGLPDAIRITLTRAYAALRTELAFSHAMHSRDATGLSDNLLPKAVAWTIPSLWPRCLALRALLTGDIASAKRLLDNVRQLAEQSIDKALPQSEAMIRTCMLSLVASDAMMSRDAA